MVVSDRLGAYPATDGNAWTMADCPDCGGSQMAVVAYSQVTSTQWFRCVNCMRGLVRHRGIISPTLKPLSIPKGVAGVELAVWKEVRECLGVGAYTAAVMMCRKLLFHVAVAHELPAKDAKDRAPSFVEAVQHLESEGLISKRMRPWVDRIKDVGNDANHEITPITEDVAMDVATFTEQLLRLTYEMPALMGADTALADPETA